MKTKTLTAQFRAKKIVAVIMAAIAGFTFFAVGCTPNKDSQSNMQSSLYQGKHESLIAKQIIFEDNNATLTATETYYIPESGSSLSNTLNIEYEVQNKSAKKMSFTTNSVQINGISFLGYSSVIVESEQTKVGSIAIPKEQLDIAGIGEIKDIKLSFYDFREKASSTEDRNATMLLTLKPVGYEKDYKEPYDMKELQSTEQGINVKYIGTESLRANVSGEAATYLVYKMVNTNDYKIQMVGVSRASLNSNAIHCSVEALSEIPSNGCTFIFVKVQNVTNNSQPTLEGEMDIQFRFFHGTIAESGYSREFKHKI